MWTTGNIHLELVYAFFSALSHFRRNKNVMYTRSFKWVGGIAVKRRIPAWLSWQEMKDVYMCISVFLFSSISTSFEIVLPRRRWKTHFPTRRWASHISYGKLRFASRPFLIYVEIVEGGQVSRKTVRWLHWFMYLRLRFNQQTAKTCLQD